MENEIFWSIKGGELSPIRRLFNKEKKIPECNWNTALHKACEYGNLNVVKFLVEKGVDLNIKNDYNFSPIKCACFSGKIEILKYLLTLQPKLKVPSDLIHFVVGSTDHIEILEFLHNTKQFNFNAIDDNCNMTPLCCAVFDGKMKMIKYLLKLKINVNAKSKFGKTPLHYAVEDRHLKIVKLLLENGANLYEKNEMNDMPIDVVCEDDENMRTYIEEMMEKEKKESQTIETMERKLLNSPEHNISAQYFKQLHNVLKKNEIKSVNESQEDSNLSISINESMSMSNSNLKINDITADDFLEVDEDSDSNSDSYSDSDEECVDQNHELISPINSKLEISSVEDAMDTLEGRPIQYHKKNVEKNKESTKKCNNENDKENFSCEKNGKKKKNFKKKNEIIEVNQKSNVIKKEKDGYKKLISMRIPSYQNQTKGKSKVNGESKRGKGLFGYVGNVGNEGKVKTPLRRSKSIGGSIGEKSKTCFVSRNFFDALDKKEKNDRIKGNGNKKGKKKRIPFASVSRKINMSVGAGKFGFMSETASSSRRTTKAPKVIRKKVSLLKRKKKRRQMIQVPTKTTSKEEETKVKFLMDELKKKDVLISQLKKEIGHKNNILKRIGHLLKTNSVKI